MKHIIISIFLLIVNLCHSQSSIFPIQGSGARSQSGAYYKDVDNVFDKFSGTWKYVDNNTNSYFIIILQKKSSVLIQEDNNYIDILIGEYEYKQNNTILVSTLSNLNLNLRPYQYNIAGLLIMDRELPIASRRVQLYFTDPERDYLNHAINVKYIPAQGSAPAKIEIEFTGDTSVIPTDTSPTEIRVPVQNYILEKQP